MKGWILTIGFILLFAVEILRVYFIMPFPGSQQSNTIDIAYWLNNNIYWIRLLGLFLVIYFLTDVYRNRKLWVKIISTIVFAFYLVVFFFFNFKFEADKMFYQLQHKYFAVAGTSKTDTNKLVIGVSINNEAKAYPIQIIGYHHQVRDTVGGEPVMVTYCTVCRTGRIFKPFVNNKPETFRLVGMDHFNAMFEDATTKSWWQQATGVAITGPLKGVSLPEIPSQQMTLAAWLRLYPNSSVLQPDSLFQKHYDSLALYDKGTIDGNLEKRDSASWKMKSWVIGVQHDQTSKAYDWNELVKKQIIEDSLPGLSLMIVVENDNASFHVWNASVNGETLHFKKINANNTFTDINTNSTWNMNGSCIDGKLKDAQLQPVQASQEFWHSWLNFHPGTLKYD